MTGIILCSSPAILRTVIANGTKVISATSFVMSMLEKKHNKTRAAYICLLPLTFSNSLTPTKWNSPILWNLAMMIIKLNSSASV